MNNGIANGKSFEMLKLESNPFTYKILPDIFVGYDKQVSKIVTSLKNEEKFSLLLGPTGSGKTNLLRYISNKFNGNIIIYLSKPPKDPNEWVEIFKDLAKPRFSIFSRKKPINLYNLSNYVNKKLKNKRCLLFVDEAHEASLESLEWLRTLTDQIDNLSTVIAGLPVLDSVLKQNLESFTKRVTTKIELSNLTRSETRELIKRRIEKSGGEDIRPFTSEIIEFIYEQSGGFPREILRLCNECIQKALEKNISTIDLDFIKENGKEEERISLDDIDSLPEKQNLVLHLLSKKGELSPSEIIKSMDLDNYKNKGNAVRAVNNILRRLMADNLIERKRKGKTYKYSVSSKFRTLMVRA